LFSCEFNVKSGAAVPTAGALLAAPENPMVNAIALTANPTNSLERNFILLLASTRAAIRCLWLPLGITGPKVSHYS
jgi:hypothetical protein